MFWGFSKTPLFYESIWYLCSFSHLLCLKKSEKYPILLVLYDTSCNGYIQSNIIYTSNIWDNLEWNRNDVRKNIISCLTKVRPMIQVLVAFWDSEMLPDSGNCNFGLEWENILAICPTFAPLSIWRLFCRKGLF